MHLQYQNMHFGSLRQQEIVGKLGEIESQVKKVNHRLAEIDRFTRINLLEILKPFLDTTQDASKYTYMFTHVPTCMPTCIHTCIHVHFRPNRTRALTRRQQQWKSGGASSSSDKCRRAPLCVREQRPMKFSIDTPTTDPSCSPTAATHLGHSDGQAPMSMSIASRPFSLIPVSGPS